MNNKQELLNACKKALQFVKKLEKNYTPYPIEPNSNSGLNWDIRYILRDAIKNAK